MSEPTISWSSGDAYERYVGRWSMLVARAFLDWLHVPAGASWLDVGCGTGGLTRVILDTQSPGRVVGVDPSEAFIAFARDGVTDNRARFDVGDAVTMVYEEEEFDAAVAGLVLNFVMEPAEAIFRMRHFVACVDGVVGAYVWDYAEKMEMIRYFWDAAVALVPAAAELNEAQRFRICTPEALEQLFTGAKLSNVETRAIDVPTGFRNFDDYWTPFLGRTGPAPVYAMSLNEERRAALRERLRLSLPVARDGSIELLARAWAVKGTR